MTKRELTVHVLSIALAIAAIALSTSVLAQTPPLDAQVLQKLATANEAVACSQERSTVAGTASGCTDSACRIAIAAIAALTQCSGTVAARMAPAPAPQIINAAPPQSGTERVLGFFAGAVGKLFDTAVAVAPSVLNWKLGVVQSDNATRLGIAQSNNALAAQQSTNGAFAAFGSNIQGTAAAGFGAATNIANAGFGAATNIAASGNQVAAAYASRATLQVTTGAGSPVTIGTGNVVNTQNGTENRQTSPGPCTATGGATTTGANSATAQAPCTN